MSEYNSWGKYAKCEHHITHEMLNKAYGDAGMFFKTKAEAQVHQMGAGGQIYPIRNYKHSDFTVGRNLKSDAKLYIEGYYVSHPPKRNSDGKQYIKRVK